MKRFIQQMFRYLPQSITAILKIVINPINNIYNLIIVALQKPVGEKAFVSFDTLNYLKVNPDVQYAIHNRQFASALNHYIRQGFREGRHGISNKFLEHFRILFEEDIALPTPSPKLRKRVHGTDDLLGFNIIGKAVTINIETFIQQMDLKISAQSRILDFGCGCGRVMSWFHRLHPSSEFYGSDLDAEAILWCQNNLSDIAKFTVNKNTPPLPFEDNFFDFVYVISIFTHLPEEMQFFWLAELMRVTRKHGYLFISVHGEQLFPLNSKNELRQFNKQGFYYQIGDGIQGLPNFYQNSYHKETYIYKHWNRYFKIKQIIKRGINNHQDLVICEKIN